ncbi:hypothetical protein [Bacillus pseudomycoides]|uniref:hypothetical protein n=1 Tax=Bacillus TaxID=1386 RepID=UPI000496AA69|nr:MULTISPECIES: hypothetical protein [Bacillus]
MKKILLTTIGCAFAVCITTGFSTLNKGDGGAPVRPDLALNKVDTISDNKGDGGGAPARPDYVNIGDGGGSPSNAHGNGGGIVAKEI